MNREKLEQVRKYEASLLQPDRRRTAVHVRALLAKHGYIHEAGGSDEHRAAVEKNGPLMYTSWDGSVCHFDSTFLPHVFQAQAKDIMAGHYALWNQTSRGRTRYGYEWDIRRENDVISEGAMIDRILAFHNVVQKYFTREHLQFVVLLAPTKMKFKSGTWVYAQGAHVVYYNTIMSGIPPADFDAARQITYDIQMHDTMEGSEVESIFDAQGARLRPAYSMKRVDCPACNGVRNGCTTCANYGYMLEPCAYVFHSAYTSAGTLDLPLTSRLKASIADMLAVTSITDCTDTPLADDYKVPDNAPLYIPPKKRRREQKDRDDAYAYPNEKHGNGDHATREHCRELLKLVTLFGAAFEGTLISEAKYVTQSKIRIHLRGNGRQFCIRKGSNHSSNRVFFDVDIRAGTIAARCWNKECMAEYKKNRALNVKTFDRSLYSFSKGAIADDRAAEHAAKHAKHGYKRMTDNDKTYLYELQKRIEFFEKIGNS